MKLPALPRFSAAEMIFSAKCFAAAMLAVYLASRAGQPRPFWALMTTYVVASPLAGMVRSKAIFRLLGTIGGSVAAVVLVPTFSNSPELLSLALALWVAFCLYMSLQDRTPRSYAFMLAGYTAALIGFPAVDTPQAMFDTAAARVEEIGLGIFAATLVHSLVLPTGLSGSILSLVDRTLADTRRWMSDLLQPGSSSATDADRRRVAADITQLRLLSVHIPFDTSHIRWSADSVHGMQDGVASLTPMLSAIEDRLEALAEHEAGLGPDISALLDQLGEWLALPDDALAGASTPLRQRIATLPEAARDDWSRALRIALTSRLETLITGWQHCRQLRADIDLGLKGEAISGGVKPASGQVLHLDRGMALLSALAALVAILICCTFWILTGWSMGSAAAMMAAIFSSFFASMDDPVPAIHGFLKWTLWSIPLSAIYVLLLLPLVQDFATLALICAPTFLLLGAWVGRPATFGIAMPILFGVCGALAMHDTSQADLVSFINSMLGQVFGIVVAARTARLMRSVGVEWSARRIQRATWKELDELASLPRLPEHGEAYLLRMLDRIALLAPKVALAGGTVPGVPVDEALRDLRLGADIVALQKARHRLPAPALSDMLEGLGAWFRQRSIGHFEAPSSALLPLIDKLILAALRTPGEVCHAAVAALVGVRRNLFPAARPAFEPVSQGSQP